MFKLTRYSFHPSLQIWLIVRLQSVPADPEWILMDPSLSLYVHIDPNDTDDFLWIPMEPSDPWLWWIQMDSSGSKYKPLYPYVSWWILRSLILMDPNGFQWISIKAFVSLCFLMDPNFKFRKCQKLFNNKLYLLFIPVLIFVWSGSYCETLEIF